MTPTKTGYIAGKKFRTCLTWSVAVLGYYMWFQSFYNVMRFGSVYPYPDLKAMLLGVANNLPPVILECLLNIVVIFILVRIKDLNVLPEGPFDVFSVDGIRVRRNAADLSGLPRGIYIVNHRKVIVR